MVVGCSGNPGQPAAECTVEAGLLDCLQKPQSIAFKWLLQLFQFPGEKWISVIDMFSVSLEATIRGGKINVGDVSSICGWCWVS